MIIPQVRERLYELAVELGCAELSELADELKRRAAEVSERKVSARMTPELTDAIRDYYYDNPKLTQLEIAAIFGVNQGRVSETIKGKRK